MTETAHRPPDVDAEGTPTALVVVPYTVGGLRPETQAAVMSWGGSFTFQALASNDPYAYARALMDWWETHLDLVVIEHDIVPAPGMIAGLLTCPQPWCGHAYHVGEGRYTTGLGLCKISRSVMDTWPSLAMLAARDGKGSVAKMEWISLNEGLDRQMSRYGYRMHLHSPAVEHLHYPAAGAFDG